MDMHKHLKRIKFYLRIYCKVIRQDILSKMSYRADFVISVFGILLTNVAGFLAFWVLFQNFSSIGGWSYYEIIFFYGFSLIALTPMQCFFDNNWNLRTNVYSGDFIKYCFRPINIFFYFMSETFNVKGLSQFVFGVASVIYSWSHLGYAVNVKSLFLFVLSEITASLFIIGIMNIAAATCFWIIGTDFIIVSIFKLTEYIRYPGNIYGKCTRAILTFAIPLTFATYYPSLLFLVPGNASILSYISPVLGIAFFIFSYKIWMLGVKRFSGTGS